MNYFPVFMNLRDQAVLVIGAGCVAERKIRLLKRAGAQIRVVARELNSQVTEWCQHEQVEWIATEFDEQQLDGARLLFAATNDKETNLAAYEAAELRGIPANVVDDREHCRFISPAIVDRKPLQIAISSGGESPVLARRIRAWIEQLLPMGLGKVAAAAGQLREQAADKLSLEQRRQFWDRLLTRANVGFLSNQSTSRIFQGFKQELERQSVDQAGRVILVGAGPGRPDLLTIRARQALGEADVILHDRLVPAEILDQARRDAEFIDVGKRAGNHHETQRNIEQLLVEHARKGRVVVRLKGGDPFVFGRGGEELEHLAEHGIEYEVVPGVTAANACAAYAGIPLTHRDYAQSLTLITGHVKPGGEQPAWAELAGPGRTLAVYMGVKQAKNLKASLLQAGLSGKLPVALVADGSRPTQQVIHGTISGLTGMATTVRKGAPGLFIIGDVAQLGQKLAWFETEQAARKAA